MLASHPRPRGDLRRACAGSCAWPAAARHHHAQAVGQAQLHAAADRALCITWPTTPCTCSGSGSRLRRLVSDPLGWGHDFFGTARAPLTALWSPAETIWYVQVALIVIGHIYGIYVAQRESNRLYADDRKAGAARPPGDDGRHDPHEPRSALWLLAQPIFMRTADL